MSRMIGCHGGTTVRAPYNLHFPMLSIVFVTLAIIVIIAAVAVTITAIRRGGGENHEDEPVPSRRFAPAGFIATPSERELDKQWEPILADERAANRH